METWSSELVPPLLIWYLLLNNCGDAVCNLLPRRMLQELSHIYVASVITTAIGFMCFWCTFWILLGCFQAKSKQLISLTKQFEVLKWEYEVLQVRFDRMQTERDELKARFSRAVLEVQQRVSLKATLLEAKLKSLEARDLGPREIHVSLLVI